jgi:hypothetical protein
MAFTFAVFRKFLSASRPSSGKKQHRGSDASTISSELKHKLDREGICPIKRTNDWLKKTETPIRKVQKSNVLGVKDSKITKTSAARASVSGKGSTKKTREKWWVSRLWTRLTSKKNDDKPMENLEGGPSKNIHNSPKDDLEGATVFGDGTPVKSIPDKTLIEEETPVRVQITEGDTTLIDDNDPTPSKGKVSAGKETETDDADIYRGWTEDEVWLFEKLDWRGYEPLLPKSWDGDFRTMYDELFTTDDSVAFIKSASGNDYHGKRTLHLTHQRYANPLLQQLKHFVASSC